MFRLRSRRFTGSVDYSTVFEATSFRLMKQRFRLIKTVAVLLFVVLTAFQVVRTAAVASWQENPHGAAVFLWPAHPDVQRAIAMVEVGTAAGQRRLPSAVTLHRLERIATMAPLAPEPLLVGAALAQKNGDSDRAERMLRQVRERNPRSIAARYLLADLFIRSGRFPLGVAELAVFSRFVPGAMEPLAPALAHYARTPGTLPQVKRILADYPDLRSPLLNQLATDTRNIDLILALAAPRSAAEQPASWELALVNNLVEEGAYQRAYGLWTRLAGVPAAARGTLFNPHFGRTRAPPPFNWNLASGSDGVADSDGEGLQILYFGRQDLTLASQLMLLPAGRYRLEMTVEGQRIDPGTMAWTVTCLPSKQQVFLLPIVGGSDRRRLAGPFRVGGEDCAAQQLELRGFAKEFAQSAKIRVTGLRLTRSQT